VDGYLDPINAEEASNFNDVIFFLTGFYYAKNLL